MRYRYGLQYRPLSPGAVPRGFIPGSQRDDENFRYGTIDYPEKLPESLMNDYELIYVGEII